MKPPILPLALLLMIGCASSPPPAAPPAPPAAPSAPAAAAEETESAAPDVVADLSLAAHWARNSAEHDAAYVQTYRAAAERLEQLVGDREAESWAVALDADETVIDNSQYEKELTRDGVSHNSERWAAWAHRAEAPPLPGALAFLARVRELGGRIAIVTNRREPLCESTERNFRAFSIPFDVILCRAEDPEKEPRWERVRAGAASPELPPLEILMWLGDNIGDFPGLDQDLRFAPEAAFAAFGDRYFVFPNAMYGSWVDNPRQ